MFATPNQSPGLKAYEEFGEAARMKPGPLHDRVVNVIEELVKFTLGLRLGLRDRSPYLTAAIAS
jgi:arsenic resistance protein ArsH